MEQLLLLVFLAILPLPMVYAQDTPLLFLGPSRYSYLSDGKSEVFSLPAEGGNLSKASCTIPDHPVPDIMGYVAFVKDGYLQLCGGYPSSTGGFQSSCYVLRDSAWLATTSLIVRRYLAAAITLQNGSVLISGGYGSGNTRSSEIMTGTTWAPALELPSARKGHCMIGLSTGEIFLHGGLTQDVARDTYLSTDLTSWQTRASSEVARKSHACTEVTMGTEQEVWVGSRGTTEIYSVATDTWRTGPALPSSIWYPGEFISYNGQLYLADSSNIYQLKAGWTQRDGWEKVGEMSGKRSSKYQAMIISQDICEGLGEKTKRTPLELTFTTDGSVGYVSGSLVPVVTKLASDSPEPLPVSCCGGATTKTTTTTCGNGTSCTNICGGDSSGCITLVLEASAEEVCGASMDQYQWCGNADIIKGLTSGCSRKRRSALTERAAAPAVSTTIIHINYCPFRVRSIGSLKKNQLCCLHPTTRRIPGVPLACCKDYEACF